MAFLISQNNGGIIPGLEYLPAGAITPQIGMALVMTDGKLAACGATTRPQYITTTWSHTSATTPRSWVIKRIEVPISFFNLFIRSRICA